MVSIPVEDLRERLSQYLKKVQNGEAFVVTDKGYAIAKIVPATGEEIRTSDFLSEMIARGQASWSGRPVDFPAPTVRLQGHGPTIADIVVENRR